MPQESRLKKSLLNARVNLIFYFLSLALSFFSRKIFLDVLGADFMGLIGTLNNLLGFLNLAELGISTAIGYVLYKPLFEHDERKINEIISVFGFIYRRIGFVILSAGCVLACFLPLIFPNNVFDLGVIYFAFFLVSDHFTDRIFCQLQANPFGSGPEELCSDSLFSKCRTDKDSPANGVSILYGQLLPVD